MTYQKLQANMARALQQHGISAEITFCRSNMFSILVDDAAQFEKAKSTMALVSNAKLDSEDICPDCGSIAYYTF